MNNLVYLQPRAGELKSRVEELEQAISEEKTMLSDKRLKELMGQVGLPNSKSLYQALNQVENETSQYWLAKQREQQLENAKLRADIQDIKTLLDVASIIR